jgi:hypothetical protein
MSEQIKSINNAAVAAEIREALAKLQHCKNGINGAAANLRTARGYGTPFTGNAQQTLRIQNAISATDEVAQSIQKLTELLKPTLEQI